MGVKANVGADKFPKQGALAGKRAFVCFNYDADRKFPALCVRDDMEEPFAMIFALDDGRYVLSTECQYQPAD